MRLLMACVLLSVVGACGDDSGVVNPADGGVGLDLVSDVSTGDDVSTDKDTAEPTPLDVAEDAVSPSTCEPGEGCFGEPCDSAADCLSGICTMHLGDKVCSKTCDATCPQGWSCTLVGSGGDGQYVCLSKFSHLCLPCEDAGTCSGDTPNACVQYADGTSFCGGACDLETPCPSGYACQEVTSVNGATSYQCVNTAGVCPCSNLAIYSTLSTPCEVANDVGTCTGVRICEKSGLTACSAGEAAIEVCNGLDDDCDGLIDNGTCDDGNACTVDTCLGEGGCEHTPLDGDECLDGDVCTIADHCEAGVCVGQPVNCDDDNACTVDACDGLGGCVYETASALCDDGDPCTVGDKCQDGGCVGSVTLVCDDGNPCTTDSCGEKGCLYTDSDGPCDDGNACTEDDSCVKGACSGAQITCDDGNLCTTDSCDLKSGCTFANNMQPCDDGDGCTGKDTCADGACLAGAEMICDDGNPCTDDACDSDSGCVFTPNFAECDDNNTCTSNDSCVKGNCIGLGDILCDDGNPCTIDSCEADGGCTHSMSIGACDDGDACTAKDACMNGVCEPGPALQCDDGNPCTTDSCQDGGCVFAPNDGECDDGNVCTEASMCKAGVCLGTQPLDCEDGNVCTTHACDPANGCIQVDNQAPCSDDDPCTLGDSCANGSCQGGVGAPVCDDGNICTDDSCVTGKGCVYTANESKCDDGSACTLGDTCKDGWCAFTAILNCDDGNACTDDTCDVKEGCISTNNEAPCSDGNICTVGDSCSEGACAPGADSLECDDGLYCNGEESCDSKIGCLSGEAPTGDDGIACTVETCDEDLDQVVSVPSNNACELPADSLCQVAMCDVDQGCVLETELNCCGNGIVEPGEDCDDSNVEDGDGCSALCEAPVGAESNPAGSCCDILIAGDNNGTGIYWLQPSADMEKFQAFCEMDRDDGGWTLIAVSAQDGQDTWTWDNRHYWDTDTTTFGSVHELGKDMKSPAYHSVTFKDLMFVHVNSDVWASYHNVGNGETDMGSFLAKLGGGELICNAGGDAGYALTAGTLKTEGKLCNNRLYFNSNDQDGSNSCAVDNAAYGPNWSIGNNNGCPMDDPGQTGALGPDASAPQFESSVYQNLGFAWALELGGGSMRIYARLGQDD